MIEGVGYVWRPWFATLNLKLNLSQTTTKMAQDDATARQQADDRLTSGEARMNLFPRSRFPLEAFADIFDSRIELDTVGVPLDQINTLRRERVGATQRYRTAAGGSDYTFHGARTNVSENSGAEQSTADLAASAVHRFGAQVLEYGASHSDTVRTEPDLWRQDDRDSIRVRHLARLMDALTIESVFDGHREESRLDRATVREDTSRSGDNFVTWHPEKSRWTVFTHLGKQTHDSLPGDTGVHSETTVGSGRVHFDITRALRMRAEAGVDRKRVDNNPVLLRTFQNVSLSYAPAPIPLSVEVTYAWSASTTVGSSDTTDERSVQSASAALQHGINRVSSNDRGRTLSTSVSQSATEFRDSRHTSLTTLGHLGSTAAQWSGSTSSSLVQFDVADSRTRGQESDLATIRDVDRVLQTADLHGNQQFSASRFSAWEADLRVGGTREIDHGITTRGISNSASLGFTYNHVFGVDRLRARSRLEYAAHRTQSDAMITATGTDEARASWDNRIDYIIGLLTLSARRTMTEINSDQTVVTVLSATRVF